MITIRILGHLENGKTTLTEMLKELTSESGSWKGTPVEVVDTPGGRSAGNTDAKLQGVDRAILVIDATEGIQKDDLRWWNALGRNRIPRVLFLNKMDLAGTDWDHWLEALQGTFSTSICAA